MPGGHVLDQAALTGVTAACQAAGLPRTSYYKWVAKAEKYGLSALMPKDRRPPVMPNAMTAEEVSTILATAVARATLGARQLVDHLAAAGVHRSASGIQKVLRRHNLGSRRQLTAIEVATRWLVVRLVVGDKNARVAAGFLDQVQAAPRGIDVELAGVLTDNGPEFTGRAFADHVADIGITHHRIPPRSPNHNSVCERVQGTVLQESTGRSSTAAESTGSPTVPPRD